MTKVAKKIRLIPGSDVAVAVRDANHDGAPVEFETGEATYRFVPDASLADERNIWRDYDPAKVLAALRAAKGAFSGLDRQRLLGDIHAQREQDSLGRPA